MAPIPSAGLKDLDTVRATDDNGFFVFVSNQLLARSEGLELLVMQAAEARPERNREGIVRAAASTRPNRLFLRKSALNDALVDCGSEPNEYIVNTPGGRIKLTNVFIECSGDLCTIHYGTKQNII
jgi:hypothetical protein